MLRDDELEALVRATRTDHFAAGFSARVMRRTESTTQRTLGATLQRYFVWMVPAAVTAIAILAIHNARTSTNGRTGIDALLSLPSVTLDAAYTIDNGSSAP